MSAAAILGKFSVGFFATPLTPFEALIFGAAMNGRGEFSFLIAEESVSDGIIDAVFGSGAVWGILAATLLSPVMFRILQRWDRRGDKGGVEGDLGGGYDGQSGVEVGEDGEVKDESGGGGGDDISGSGMFVIKSELEYEGGREEGEEEGVSLGEVEKARELSIRL